MSILINPVKEKVRWTDDELVRLANEVIRPDLDLHIAARNNPHQTNPVLEKELQRTAQAVNELPSSFLELIEEETQALIIAVRKQDALNRREYLARGYHSEYEFYTESLKQFLRHLTRFVTLWDTQLRAGPGTVYEEVLVHIHLKYRGRNLRIGLVTRDGTVLEEHRYHGFKIKRKKSSKHA